MTFFQPWFFSGLWEITHFMKKGDIEIESNINAKNNVREKSGKGLEEFEQIYCKWSDKWRAENTNEKATLMIFQELMLCFHIFCCPNDIQMKLQINGVNLTAWIQLPVWGDGSYHAFTHRHLSPFVVSSLYSSLITPMFISPSSITYLFTLSSVFILIAFYYFYSFLFVCFFPISTPVARGISLTD